MNDNHNAVNCLFTDIDDTISSAGKITAAAYAALWRAHDAGLAVVQIGRAHV